MRTLKYLTALFLTIIVFASCEKLQTLPDRPHIEFRSFAVFDTTDILGNECKGGRLNFYFEDGDGDLGIEAPVYETDDTVNMFFNLYRKSGILFTEVPEDDLLDPSDYRIPYMERLGQNKILKGTITVSFLYLFYDIEDTDTLKYEFYIKDRALNVSDTATTCEIPLSFNGIYQ